MKRMLRKLKPMNLNCLEVTGIVAKRFLGVPYTVISARTRAISNRVATSTAPTNVERPSTMPSRPAGERGLRSLR